MTNDRNQKTTEEDKSHDLYKDDQQQATITTEMHETDQAKTKHAFSENYCPNETETHRTMTENKTETSQNNGAKYRTEWSTSDGSGANKNGTCLTNTGELERQIQLQQGGIMCLFHLISFILFFRISLLSKVRKQLNKPSLAVA